MPPMPGDDGYCIGCGQSLRGVRSGRCPECSARFDPAEPRTFSRAPGLFHRATHHFPEWRRHWLRRFAIMRCRTCGAALGRPREPGHCPGCGHRYDPQESDTVILAPAGVPPFIVRFMQGSFLLGIVLAALLATWAILSVRFGLATTWPGWRGPIPPPRSSGVRSILGFGGRSVGGPTSTFLGFVLLGAAISAHCHWFWGRIEPTWRYAPLGRALGLAIMFLALIGFAVWMTWAVANR
ncbi:MAG: hypothetical protein U0625_09370 [Phycisphaerales bacterium]